jgi:hypothetical protein
MGKGASVAAILTEAGTAKNAAPIARQFRQQPIVERVGSSRQHDAHRMISLEEPPLSLTGKTKAHASKTEVKASRTSFPAVPPEMTQTERWLADVLVDAAMPILQWVGLNRSSARTRRIRCCCCCCCCWHVHVNPPDHPRR